MKRKVTSVALVTGLGLSGCGLEPPAERPSYGVVSSLEKDTFQQYKSVYSCEPELDIASGDLKTVCEDRDKKARKINTRLVKIVLCRKENGVVVAATREYLANHATYPSDYPVVAEGKTDKKVLCSTQVEVVARDLGDIGRGSVVDLEQLDRITPEYYE